jgi:N-carbamoylputrescine amidase
MENHPVRPVTFATLQFACTWDQAQTVDTAERLVREAAARGAQVILPQELFETPYFCSIQHPRFLNLARPLVGHPTVERFRQLARELGVVVPISVYELAGLARFNTTVVIDADGKTAGIYRKSHIPQNPGYEEKYYFSPGDTGLRAMDTAYGRLGLGICWDQWFPETARALVLDGAEFLLYPTAIGSEPADPSYDSMSHWQMVMRGHAAANIVPVVASNRIGTETEADTTVTFYGSSFIGGPTGDLIAVANRTEESILTATFDLDTVAALRATWGVFRDRRPDLYGAIATLDGRTP